MVSASNFLKSRSSIDSMIVWKSPPSNLRRPGPPGKRVSPLKRIGVPSTAKQIEPGVCPGVATVRIRRLPDLDHDVVLDHHVVGREHRRVGGGHPHRVPGVTHGGHRLDVVPVPVGLEHLPDPEVPAELEQLLVLVGGVDQDGVAGLLAPDHVDVVVHRADYDLVDLDEGVLVLDCGRHGASSVVLGCRRLPGGLPAAVMRTVLRRLAACTLSGTVVAEPAMGGAVVVDTGGNR